MELRAGYKQTEVGVIPDDWEVGPVGKYGEVITGKALAVNGPGAQRPYLRTKNVFDGRIDIDDVLTMPMTDEQFAQFRLRYGDVLLNEGQSLELVGRCAMYRNEYPEPCAIQNQLLRFRPRSGVSADFATYLFRQCQQTGVFARIALQTTSIAHLGGSRFEGLRLAWPNSEDEQHAIAAALSDADALIASLDGLIAKKRDLKQAAMQRLLAGKTRLPGFTGEWEMRRLGEFCETVTKGTTPTTIGREFVRNGVTFFKVEAISENGDFLPEMFAFVDEKTDALLARSRLRAGDILFSIAGALGRVAVVSERFLPGNTNQALAIIRLKRNAAIDGSFLRIWLAGPQIATYVAAISVQAAQANISLADVRSFMVPLPIVEEQTAIAEFLSNMDAELLAIEAKREKARAMKQGMMQELLTGRIRLV